MAIWLVTLFDEHKRKEQFHVEGSSAADAVDDVAHTLVRRSATIGYKPVEIHVQLLTPAEAGSLIRTRP